MLIMGYVLINKKLLGSFENLKKNEKHSQGWLSLETGIALGKGGCLHMRQQHGNSCNDFERGTES